MGSVINNVSNQLMRLIGKFLGFESGIFELAHGNHVVTVPLKITPTQVWTKVMCGNTDGCGQVPLNQVGHRIGEKSVTFYVEVQSESVTVDWFAVLSKD